MNDHEYRLCGVEEVPSAGGLRVAIPGRDPVAVFKVGEGFVVVDDRCTHNGASLAKNGEVVGDAIECLWHGGLFDLRTGEVLDGPCPRPLGVHPSSSRNGAIYIAQS